MRRRSDSLKANLKANLCQAQQRDLKTIAPLSHRPIVLTDTISTIGLSVFGSRPSGHYFRSVCLSVCLFVCEEVFSAVFDPIWIKLGHMLYVRV